jgi:hypothetical protein
VSLKGQKGALRRKRRRKSSDGGIRKPEISFRVSEKERDLLRSAAREAGVSMTDYVLARCLYADDIPPMPPRDELRETRLELTRQGVNLNQLAKAAHRLVAVAYGDEAPAAEVGELVDELLAMKEDLLPDANEADRTYRRLLAFANIHARRR